MVLDSSVLVAALADSGPHGAWAEGVLAGGSLCAPELVHVETMNVLRHLERSKLLTTADAAAARDDLMLLNIQLYTFEPFADRVGELRDNLTSCDAWYVALAEALQFPLATLDLRLAKAPGVDCKFLTPGL